MKAIHGLLRCHTRIIQHGAILKSHAVSTLGQYNLPPTILYEVGDIERFESYSEICVLCPPGEVQSRIHWQGLRHSRKQDRQRPSEAGVARCRPRKLHEDSGGNMLLQTEQLNPALRQHKYRIHYQPHHVQCPELALAERFFSTTMIEVFRLAPPDNLSWLLLNPKAMLLCRKFAGSDFSLIQSKHILDLSAQIDVFFGKFRRVVREQAQNILRYQHLAITLGRCANTNGRNG